METPALKEFIIREKTWYKGAFKLVNLKAFSFKYQLTFYNFLPPVTSIVSFLAHTIHDLLDLNLRIPFFEQLDMYFNWAFGTQLFNVNT